MRTYFYLQLKRVCKLFPFVLAVTLALLVGLGVILMGVIQIFGNGEDEQRFKIAITGDTDNDYLKWGMTAMQTLDESRFAVEFVEMAEPDAESALKSGGISAYVVLPENFVDRALHGEVDPIRYVTTPGVGGLTSMFKNEITKLVTDMVVYSQKGTYGIYDVMKNNGLGASAGKNMTRISIEYMDLIFRRSDIYTVEELGIAGGLSVTEYLVSGITVLLLALVGLPYATVYVHKDRSLSKLLLSRGYSGQGQLLCEYASHLITLLLLVAVLFVAVGVGVHYMPQSLSAAVSPRLLIAFAMRLIPILMMLAAFNMLVFSATDNIVSGVLLHFFICLALCYVTGCLYPPFAFPKVVQQLSPFLPMGVARDWLAGAFDKSLSSVQLAGVLLYAALFFAAALAVRTYKIKNKRG